MNNVIKAFFDERKTAWLKSRIKASMSDEEKAIVEQACEEKFSLDNWLPDAARRAGQLSMVTHPGKFSHPGARVSAVIADAEKRADGFLRTGNCGGALDTIGNAAALDVKSFLSLKLDDGKELLRHIDEGSDTAKKELAVSTAAFEEIREGFLAVKQNDETAVTSGKVKQVYFPCADSYHLLSVLAPSGLMFELRERVNDMRFSAQAKEARELRRKGAFSDTGYDDLYNLTMIGYGGTKPQNISVLNNKNGGRAYLLPCIPPLLKKRKVRLPKYNFFENSLRASMFNDSFKGLHKLMAGDYNKANIRAGRDNIICFVIDRVIHEMWSIREMDAGWSQSDYYSRLPAHQKTWLDDINLEERENTDGWMDIIVNEFSRWIVHFYKKVMGKQAVFLGDEELRHIKALVEQNREALQ